MKFNSINKKLLNSVFLVTLILGIIVSIVSFQVELQRAKSQTNRMLNQLLDTVEDSASIAVYSRNKQIAMDVLNGLLKNDIVDQVQIYGDKDFNFKQSKSRLTNDEETIKHLLVSPFGDGEELGYLLVQPTSQFIINEARHGALPISSPLLFLFQ